MSNGKADGMLKSIVKAGLPEVPPVVKGVLKQVAHTALHAAVFSYVGKKVANWVDAKKVRVEAEKK